MQSILMLLCCGIVTGQYYDSFTGKEINRTRYDAMNQLGLVPICAMQVAPCDAHAPRRMDLSCNNFRFPTRGAAFTPFARMLPPVFAEGGSFRRSRSGQPLPPARALRVAVMSDGRRPHKRFTHMLVNYMVFITGDSTSVHDTVNYVAYTLTCCQPGGEQNPACMPIEVRDDDLHLRLTNVRCLNLTRAITYQRLGCVSDNVPLERFNIAAPMLDLSGVYGHDENSARRGREFVGGRLKTDTINGKEWPPSGGAVCVNNVPPRETRCHDTPSPGANALMGLNLIVIWYYRSHNAIAAALRKLNPCWDDNKVYYTAREINIAYSLHIFYYEVIPELFGWEFLLHNKIVFQTDGHVNDYDPALEPRLTIEYTTATRWFHTLQEGTLKLYKPDGRLYGSLQTADLNLRTGVLPIDGNIEGMTQGSFRQAGGGMDEVVDPDMGERALGRLQFASDVISSDIMKGRDFGLPPYNQYRKACGLPKADKFKDLLGWMDRPQVEALASLYEHPDDIDLMVALLAEKPMPGAELGPTLACVVADQLLRWRRADRFWFEHSGQPGAFTTAQLREVRKMSISKLLCQHGDSVDSVQPHATLVPGKGNEIKSCAEYEMPDLSVFRDDRCYPHTMSRHEEYLNPTPRHEEYQNPTPRQEEYLNPTPRYEEYLHPTLRNTDRTTLKDYLTQILNTNDKPINYPTNPYNSNAFPDDFTSNPTSFRQGSLPHDIPTIMSNNGDRTSIKGYNIIPEKSVNFNVDSILTTQKPNGYPTSTKQGYNIDPTKIIKVYVDPTLKQDPNPKSTGLFPTKDPNVKIYPNADPVPKKKSKVSIPEHSNVNSKPKSKNLANNIHPRVRNQKYPFEEFLQNYWLSSSNSFKALLS